VSTICFTPLADIKREPYEQAFLIGDLLTSRITFLTGEPKAGKSLFAAAMIRALLEGDDEFLSLPVHRHLAKVVYGYTDDGADSELRERFDGTTALAGISVLAMHDLPDEQWAALPHQLAADEVDLFVLDTVVGSLPDGADIAAGVTAQQVIKRVRPISQAGIPVLLVTHTPKGAGEGLTTASSVMGGRAMAGGARGVIALRKDKHGRRRVTTTINRAMRDLNLEVTVQSESPGSEVPVWSIKEAKPNRHLREAGPIDEIVARILHEQPEVDSINALANHYTDKGTRGLGASTLRTKLTEAVVYQHGQWVAIAA
jgi:hypothetical protein